MPTQGSPDIRNFKNFPLSSSLDENIDGLRHILGDSSDLLLNPFEIAGIRCNLVCFEGMISTKTITNLILVPLTNLVMPAMTSSEGLFAHIRDRMLLTVDRVIGNEYGDLVRRLMSGFAVLFIDGTSECFLFGVQGYATRGIDEPSSEGNIYGSHEGFVETVRTNMSLVRRRIKSPLLRFELFSVTELSNVDVIIAFMCDRVPKKLVKRVRKRLEGMKLETVLSSGYIEPFLNNTRLSLFSGVSTTERPDVFCAKILEGRIGLMIEGTPFSLVLPALFIENFQTLDDYTFRPYYSTFIRWIRYAAFWAAVFLPAFYVAVVTFHPEFFNSTLITALAEAEKNAPLPIAAEAIFVLVFYEIIKEAGVRLPKSVGGAVSIVGGLIIGDAAVSAGIISNPLLLVCAISVTASFVVPSLNQPVTILRFISVIAGGIYGLFGVSLVAALMVVNICSLENAGTPLTSPLTPYTPRAMRDVFLRAGFRRLENDNFTVESLHGSDLRKYR